MTTTIVIAEAMPVKNRCSRRRLTLACGFAGIAGTVATTPNALRFSVSRSIRQALLGRRSALHSQSSPHTAGFFPDLNPPVPVAQTTSRGGNAVAECCYTFQAAHENCRSGRLVAQLRAHLFTCEQTPALEDLCEFGRRQPFPRRDINLVGGLIPRLDRLDEISGCLRLQNSWHAANRQESKHHVRSAHRILQHMPSVAWERCRC